VLAKPIPSGDVLSDRVAVYDEKCNLAASVKRMNRTPELVRPKIGASSESGAASLLEVSITAIDPSQEEAIEGDKNKR
jgi:hypothetical protein